MAMESWVHGHSVQLETPEKVNQVWRAGFYAKVESKPGTENWLHFAIPTPAKTKVDKVMLVFTLGSDATLANVAAWDGGINIMPNRSIPDFQTTIADSTGTHDFWAFNLNNVLVNFGVGISVQLKSGNVQTTQPDLFGHVWTPRTIAVIAAGCNFVD